MKTRSNLCHTNIFIGKVSEACFYIFPLSYFKSVRISISIAYTGHWDKCDFKIIIKTKNGTTLWRGTSIRSLIDNPIYIGIYHMQGVQSEPFDHLKIIDEDLFMRCQQTVKARSTKNFDGEPVVFRTDTRSLLTGIIFCGHCGCRLCYNHQHEERKLASGGTSVYDYETYRCYRKISASRTCDGQSSYKATALNEAVEQQVKLFLSKLEAVPKERLVGLGSARNAGTYKVG